MAANQKKTNYKPQLITALAGDVAILLDQFGVVQPLVESSILPKGNTHIFGRINLDTGGDQITAADVTAPGEGVDTSLSKFDATPVELTPVGETVATDVTDQMKTGNASDPRDQSARILAAALAGKVDRSITAKFDDFTNVVGTGIARITMTDIDTAMALLSITGAFDLGMAIHSVLHPQMYWGLNGLKNFIGTREVSGVNPYDSTGLRNAMLNQAFVAQFGGVNYHLTRQLQTTTVGNNEAAKAGMFVGNALGFAANIAPIEPDMLAVQANANYIRIEKSREAKGAKDEYYGYMETDSEVLVPQFGVEMNFVAQATAIT